jgi:hypothetical protein
MRKAIGGRRSAHAMSAFVGLDVRSEKTYAIIIDKDGKIIGHEKLANRCVPEFLRQFSTKGRGMKSTTLCITFES